MTVALLFLLIMAAQQPPQSAVYSVPYRLTDTKHLVVRAKLNGKGPFSFIVDTGSPALVISRDLVKRLTSVPEGEVVGKVDTLEIEGGILLRDVQVAAFDPFQLKAMNTTGLADADIAGVIGYNVLAQFRLEIDLTKRHMVWTDQGVKPEEVTLMRSLPGGQRVRVPSEMKQMEELAKSASSVLGRSRRPVRARGWLGIEIADGEQCARVVRVIPGSPAAKSGLKEGDLIRRVSTGGPAAEISNAEDLFDTVAGIVGGGRLIIVGTRGGKPLRVTVTAERAAL